MICYLCGQKHIHQFASKNGYLLLRCSECGLIFYQFNGDYQKFLDRQYHQGYFQGQKDLRSYFDYGGDKEIISRNFKWYLQKIIEYKKSGRLLDLGCAYGFFLELAQKYFDVFGIDPSEYAIKQAKRKFPQHVKQGIISKISFSSKFDVITLFDVFEHLQDPKKDLSSIHKLLQKNGLLVISTGNTGSFWSKLMGGSWTFYNPPQHIYYFNQQNITKLLEQSGFKVLKINKNGKWLRFHYIFHLASTVGESKLAKIVYPLVKNNIFGRLPFYIKLNDNMVIFAQKIS